MLDIKKYRMAAPIAAAIIAAGAVGGTAIASDSGHAAAKKKSSSKKGARGPRGRQGPAGPQGPAGSNGAPGAKGADSSGSTGTILYAANKFVPIPNGPTTPPPTVIYSGHGLLFTGTCDAAGALKLAVSATTNGNAIKLDTTATAVFSANNGAAPPVAIAPLDVIGNSRILFASTDGAVVSLNYATSTTQPGANCFVFGTRVGG